MKIKYQFISCIVFLTLFGCTEKINDTQPQAIDAPSQLELQSLNKNSLIISWIDNSSNEDGFVIERSENDLEFVEITSVNKNATSYTDNSVDHLKKYSYRIKSFNDLNQFSYSDTLVTTYTLISAELVTTLTEHESDVTALEISPDNKLLISAENANKIIFWDLQNFQNLFSTIWDSLGGHVNSIAFSQTGSSIICGGESTDGFIKVFNSKDGSVITKSPHIEGAPGTIISINENLDIIGRYNGSLISWSIIPGSSENFLMNWKLDIMEGTGQNPLGINTNKNLLATDFNNDFEIALIDPQTGMILRSVLGPFAFINSVDFHKSLNMLIATVYRENVYSIRLFDIDDLSTIKEIPSTSQSPLFVKFINDSDVLVTISADKYINFIDINSENIVKQFFDMDFIPLNLTVSNDGNFLAVRGRAFNSFGFIKVFTLELGWLKL